MALIIWSDNIPEAEQAVIKNNADFRELIHVTIADDSSMKQALE